MANAGSRQRSAPRHVSAVCGGLTVTSAHRVRLPARADHAHRGFRVGADPLHCATPPWFAIPARKLWLAGGLRMNYGRLVGAAVAATVFDAVYGYLVYGVLLANSFAAFPG